MSDTDWAIVLPQISDVWQRKRRSQICFPKMRATDKSLESFLEGGWKRPSSDEGAEETNTRK